MTRGHLRRQLPLTVAAVLLAVGTAWAAPSVDCRAEAAGARALVTIDVQELFDTQLLRLVQLGMVGRLRVEAALYRRRPLWFDARVADLRREFGIGWSAEESSLFVDGKRATTSRAEQRMQLPVLSLLPEGGSAGDYVEVNLRLEVVTASSLGEVARWVVRGGDNEVPRALVNYLAADLARKAACRCPVH